MQNFHHCLLSKTGGVTTIFQSFLTEKSSILEHQHDEMEHELGVAMFDGSMKKYFKCQDIFWGATHPGINSDVRCFR